MIRAVLFDLDDTLFDHRYGARMALDGVRAGHECFQHATGSEFERAPRGDSRGTARCVCSPGSSNWTMRGWNVSGGCSRRPAWTPRDALGARRGRLPRAVLASWRDPCRRARRCSTRCSSACGSASCRTTCCSEQEEKLRYCGFEPWLMRWLSPEEAGISKPDPGIFAIALERLDCEPSRAVMIGDAWRADVAGARAAGIRAIWFNRRR